MRDVLTVEVGSFGAFARSALALATRLRSARYDAVVDFEQFMKLSGILAFVTGARARVGFNTEGQARGWLYTHRIAYADTDHMADIFMRTALPFGRAILPAPRVRLAVDAAERAAGARASSASTPASRWSRCTSGTGPNYDKIALKRWDVERFAALADDLASRARRAHRVHRPGRRGGEPWSRQAHRGGCRRGRARSRPAIGSRFASWSRCSTRRASWSRTTPR